MVCIQIDDFSLLSFYLTSHLTKNLKWTSFKNKLSHSPVEVLLTVFWIHILFKFLEHKPYLSQSKVELLEKNVKHVSLSWKITWKQMIINNTMYLSRTSLVAEIVMKWCRSIMTFSLRSTCFYSIKLFHRFQTTLALQIRARIYLNYYDGGI